MKINFELTAIMVALEDFEGPAYLASSDPKDIQLLDIIRNKE